MNRTRSTLVALALTAALAGCSPSGTTAPSPTTTPPAASVTPDAGTPNEATTPTAAASPTDAATPGESGSATPGNSSASPAASSNGNSQTTLVTADQLSWAGVSWKQAHAADDESLDLGSPCQLDTWTDIGGSGGHTATFTAHNGSEPQVLGTAGATAASFATEKEATDGAANFGDDLAKCGAMIGQQGWQVISKGNRTITGDGATISTYYVNASKDGHNTSEQGAVILKGTKVEFITMQLKDTQGPSTDEDIMATARTAAASL